MRDKMIIHIGKRGVEFPDEADRRFGTIRQNLDIVSSSTERPGKDLQRIIKEHNSR